MPFPDSPRELYQKNPLKEVACQIKFPPILRIDAESPFAFQEQIRQSYPNYEPKNAEATPPNMPAELRRLVISVGAPPPGMLRHQFKNQNDDYAIILDRGSLVFATSKYTRWEHFKDRFLVVWTAFCDVYKPTSITRAGLRYIDLLDREKLGLQDHPWADLLKPHIAGPLVDPDIAKNVDGMKSEFHTPISGEVNVFVTIKTGLQTTKGTPPQRAPFMIDSEFHTHSQVELNDAIAKLDTFHKYGGRLFRFAITQTLRDALEPKLI